MKKPVAMRCCICGEYAGVWKQHWNRDNGYGICKSCAEEEADCSSSASMQDLYGKPNINYEGPTLEAKNDQG